MKSRSVLLAGIVSVVSLAGCATYDDDDHYRVRAPDDVQRGPYSALEVYSLPDFRGETMKFDRDGHTLDRMISDNGVGSLVIREGRWQLCRDVREGICRAYEPGRYGSLGPLTGAPVLALRRVD
jgi:hypothetical protein